jgi:hypothetical protein
VTSRDTHDIVAHASETSGTNVQPRLVAELLAKSDPCLFGNASEPAVRPAVVSGWTHVAMAIMHDAIRWHARLQVEFFAELNQEELV